MIQLIPEFKDYIWGGTKLKTDYGKISSLDKVAESWEFSTHKDGPSTIANGPYKGKTLKEFLKEDLSILIKLIDAKDNLSVQVHPTDTYALQHEGDLGKTEMWYVLDCEEGAKLIYGFTKDLTKEEFKTRIENNTLTEVLNYVDVQKGDVFFIEAGTLHAIGAGIQIAEIQESSNVTYRVYDYGRVGLDGKPRDLHIEKALEVTHLVHEEEPKVAYEFEKHGKIEKAQLVDCEYFKVDLLKIDGKTSFEVDETSYQVLLVTEGELTVTDQQESLKVSKGQTVFMPARQGIYTLEGKGEFLLTRV
jgi:mannose-6-phosphate isomerase